MTKDRAKAKAELYLRWADQAEKKSKEISDAWYKVYRDFDWTQPILRGHHSQRRHEKVFERRDAVFTKMRELDDKAKSHRSKAENLLHFANTNKGDAERKRQAERDRADEKMFIGAIIFCHMYGAGTLRKINKKTYTVEFKRGFTLAVDKSWCDLITP